MKMLYLFHLMYDLKHSLKENQVRISYSGDQPQVK